MGDLFSKRAALVASILPVGVVVGWLLSALTNPEKLLAEAIPPPDALVSLNCVELVKHSYQDKEGRPLPVQLRTFKLRTKVDLSDIRFRVGHLLYILDWAVSSDGMAESQAQGLVSTLPTGLVESEYVYGDVPHLMAGTDITLQIKEVAPPNFDCSSDWVLVSAQGGKIFHEVWPDMFMQREGLIFSTGPNIYKWAFVALFLCCFLYWLFGMRERLAKRGRGGWRIDS